MNKNIVHQKLAEHYNKAVVKHPSFTSRLFTRETAPLFKEMSNFDLHYTREQLARENENMCDSAQSVLQCEVFEIQQAYAQKDYEHAIDECYDAMAVLLRMVEVLEIKAKIHTQGGKDYIAVRGSCKTCPFANSKGHCFNMSCMLPRGWQWQEK